MSSPQVERMLVILRSAVRMSQLSNREVERRLEWSSGYLSRLFAQDMELKVEHILCICQAIGFSPAEFFRVIFPRHPDHPAPSWAHALSRLHPVPDGPPDTPPPMPTRSTAAARSEAASGRPPSKRGRPPAVPPTPPTAAAAAGPISGLNQGDLEKMLLSALRNLLLNPASPPPAKPEDPKPRRPQG